MGVNGTYVLEKSENLEAFLKGLGIADDKISQLAAAKPSLVLNLSGNTLTLTSKSHVETTNTLTLGTDSPYKFAMGLEIQVNLNLDPSGNGNGTIKIGGKDGTVKVQSTDTHFIETFNIGGLTCVRHYKRT